MSARTMACVAVGRRAAACVHGRDPAYGQGLVNGPYGHDHEHEHGMGMGMGMGVGVGVGVGMSMGWAWAWE